MKQLKKWLEKKGIENYRTEIFGNDYFYNVPCPAYKVFHFCFELTDNKETTKKALETIESIKKYCHRYSYDLFNEQSIFGGVSYTFFYIANRSEREKAFDYFRFVEMSINECNDLRHKKGLYPGLNKDMKAIMNEYEKMYLDFMEAIKQAA